MTRERGLKNVFRTLRRSVVFLSAAGCLFWTAAAHAQTPLHVPPDDGGYLQWVVTGGIAALVLFPVLLNPKRSHLNA